MLPRCVCVKPVVQKAGDVAKSVGTSIKNAAGSLFKPSSTIVRSPTPQQVINRAPQQARPVVEEILKKGTSTNRPHVYHNYDGKLPTINPNTLQKINYTAHDLQPGKVGKKMSERALTGSDRSIWYTANHYLVFTRLK